jgi:hypothetical protein
MLQFGDNVSFLLQAAAPARSHRPHKRTFVGEQTMSIAMILASALVVQAPAPGDAVEVAYPEMVAGRSTAAIDKIERASPRDSGHPARLINLGIAQARLGNEDEARKLFAEAASCNERYWLETAAGEWVDARTLARDALARLDRGEFTATTLASR